MSNSISFVGKLGKDSERQSYAKGQFLKFSVAENVGWGDKKTTNWWNCTLFGKQAEGSLMDYLTKGAQVFIVGEVSFTQGNDGKTYNNLTIKHIELIGSKQSSGGGASQGNQQNSQQGYSNQSKPQQNTGGGYSDLDDNLPFMRLDSRLA